MINSEFENHEFADGLFLLGAFANSFARRAVIENVIISVLKALNAEPLTSNRYRNETDGSARARPQAIGCYVIARLSR